MDEREVLEWRGWEVVDRDGDKVGKLEEIYLDRATGRPEWALVHTGLLGLRSTFVPLAGAVAQGGRVVVRSDKRRIKDAPSIDRDGALSQEEEQRLYDHYGLDYGREASGGPDPGEGDGAGAGHRDRPGTELEPAAPTMPAPVDDRARELAEPDRGLAVPGEVGGPQTTDPAPAAPGEVLDPETADPAPAGQGEVLGPKTAGQGEVLGPETADRGDADRPRPRERREESLRLTRYVVTEYVPVEREEIRIEREPANREGDLR